MVKMMIKRLTTGDEARACEISEKIYGRKIGPEQVSEFLTNPLNHLLAAYIGGELAAFLVAYELQRNDGLPNMMYLHRIDTLEQYRRRGAGRALITELKRICRERGVCKMWVLSETTEGALGLYAATGGRLCEGAAVMFEYEDFREMKGSIEE